MSIQRTAAGLLTAEAEKDLDQVLHPGRYYARPADVLGDLELTTEERRSILASWASDACAVESAPALRRPPSALEPVTFDEIMDALVQLDGLPTMPGDDREPSAGSKSADRVPTLRDQASKW